MANRVASAATSYAQVVHLGLLLSPVICGALTPMIITSPRCAAQYQPRLRLSHLLLSRPQLQRPVLASGALIQVITMPS